MDILSTVVVGGLAVTLLFFFPLVTMSDRAQDIAQVALEAATEELADKVRTTGVLTQDDYDKYVEKINATGNTYDVEMKIGVLDENPGKKTAQVENTKIGENVRYDQYTSQILEKLEANGKIEMKEGWIFSVSAKNTNATLSQQLNNILYAVSGKDAYTLEAQSSGIVAVNGN